MKATIKTHKTNATLFVNERSYTIDWDGLEFGTRDAYKTWIDDSLEPAEGYDNYDEVRLSLEIATDGLRPDEKYLIYMYIGDKPSGYVATKEDVDNNGWTDIDAENFMFNSEADADKTISELEGYCKEMNYQNCRFKKESV